MSAQLAVAHQAAEQIDAAHAWWAANRPAAPELFEAELLAAIERILQHPDSGQPYDHPTVPGVRRALLRRSAHHLYYLYRPEADTVLLLALWGGEKKAKPPIESTD